MTRASTKNRFSNTIVTESAIDPVDHQEHRSRFRVDSAPAHESQLNAEDEDDVCVNDAAIAMALASMSYEEKDVKRNKEKMKQQRMDKELALKVNKKTQK